ncbi:MAG: Hsp20/alpha crystallin family protein [Candidatus Rokuibacteriota bacterium]
MRYRRLASRYTLLVAGGRVGAAATYWRPGRLLLAEARWRPETDVYETPGALTVTIEVAGVDPDALDVLLFDDALVVEGERRLPPEDAVGVYRAVEILQGAFRVQVPLDGPIDAERVDARYEQGLLRITVPKAGR